MVLCASAGHAHAHAQLVRARGIAPTARHGEALVSDESKTTKKIRMQGLQPTTNDTGRGRGGTAASSVDELENVTPATVTTSWTGDATETTYQHAKRRLQGIQHHSHAHAARYVK